MIPSVTDTQVFTALRSFLLNIFPAGIEVVRGQQNRVPEPVAANFASMIEISRERIATNETESIDCSFKGLVDGTLLMVTDIYLGEIVIGSTLLGDGITAGTIITEEGEEPNTFVVDPEQSVSWRKMAAGRIERMQATKITIQVDVHGPDSAENIQTLSTMFRSDYAAEFFTESGVTPLMCGDPRQMPFLNDSSQVEQRWNIDLDLQINPAISLPQQFADEIITTLYPGDPE